VVEEGLLSEAAQNVINSLQERRAKLMMRVMQLEAIAKRCAFEVVVNDSWKAKQQFRDAEQETDRLTSEIEMLNLALQEAYTRLQQRGRDANDIMKELGLTGIGTE
jgi:predicted RNase H-like nuclease (RuvC/YqgF family)